MDLSMRLFTVLGLLAALLLIQARPPAVAAETEWSVIGFSQGGMPLVIHHIGQGQTRVLVIGGQHGGPEANTIELADRLLAHFSANPLEIPSGLGLDVL